MWMPEFSQQASHVEFLVSALA